MPAMIMAASAINTFFDQLPSGKDTRTATPTTKNAADKIMPPTRSNTPLNLIKKFPFAIVYSI